MLRYLNSKINRRTLVWLWITIGGGLCAALALMAFTYWLTLRASEDAYATVLCKQSYRTAARLEAYIQSFLVHPGQVAEPSGPSAGAGAILETRHAEDIVALERFDGQGRIQGSWSALPDLQAPLKPLDTIMPTVSNLTPTVTSYQTNRYNLVAIHLPVTAGTEFEGVLAVYIDTQTLLWRCFPPFNEPLLAGFTLRDTDGSVIAQFNRPELEPLDATRPLRSEPLFTEPERGMEAYRLRQGDKNLFLAAAAPAILPGQSTWQVETAMVYNTVRLAPRALFKSLVIICAWLLPLYGFLLLFTFQRLLRAVSGEETTQQRGELELMQSHLLTLIESLSGAVYIADAADCREPDFIAPRIEQFTGYKPVELLAAPKKWLALINPDRQAEVMAARQDAANGARRIIDYPMRARNGDDIPVRETIAPVRDQDGHITRIIGTIDFIIKSANIPGTDTGGAKPATELPPRNTSRGRILLADDDALLVSLCTRYLARAGFGTLPAYNGIEAVELFKTQPEEIDLVIIDMIMPRMSGLEAVTHLRKIKPEVKIIGISGYSQDGSEWDMFQNKVSAFLAKPFQPEELIQLATKFSKGE